MGRLRALFDRLHGFFTPPKRRPPSWIVGEEAAPEAAPQRSIREVLIGFIGFWGRVRTRVFRWAAGLLVLVCLALGVALYSNVWYLNLVLYTILVPNILILIHYLRLTRRE